MQSSPYLLYRYSIPSLALLCIIVALFSFAYAKQKQRYTTDIVSSKKFTRIVGAVAKEQTIEVQKGMYIADILSEIQVLPDADISMLRADKIVVPDEVILIPFKNKVTLFITGAVKKEQLFIFDSACPIYSIDSKIDYTEFANQRYIRLNKRIVNTFEVITVPKIQKKQPNKKYQ